MKKILSIGLFSMLIVVVLAGCGSASVVEETEENEGVVEESTDEADESADEEEESAEEVENIESADNYKYDSKAGTLTSIADDEVVYTNEDYKTTVLYPQGVQGNKLIVWKTMVDNSPGPCFSIWTTVSEYKNLFYIDLEAEDKNLERYLVPDFKVKEAEKWVEDCIEEIQ